MKSYGKKIFIYIFCGLLTFSCVASSYYKTSHAMEWVGGALAFEEALKWLLACIGITATAGMTDAYWDAYGDDFTDYAIENGATQTEVAEWQLKACEGVIDKGSVVWEKFKDWASSLVGVSSPEYPPSGSGSFNFSLLGGQTVYNTCLSLNSNLGLNILPTAHGSDICYGVFVFNTVTKPSYQYGFLLTDTSYTTFNYPNNNRIGFKSIDGSFFNYLTCNASGSSYAGGTTCGDGSRIVESFTSNIAISDGKDVSSKIGWISSSVVTDSNFESVTTNVNDLDVISSDGVDEDNPEVTIPMPGVSDSDNEVSKDAYQDIIDAINDGTITQEQGVEQIQEILKIITYDTVTDKVVPPQVDPDTGEDKTKDDVLKENKENMGFTLAGLENVFPFCIPFDIYAFMTLLVADPVAPEVDFPIKSINGEVEEIHIDLSPFDSVAVVVRYIFDFLFIIGLGILTRSLIGGGSSD